MLGDRALDEGWSERLARIDEFDTLHEALAPYAVLPLRHPHQSSIDTLPANEAGDS